VKTAWALAAFAVLAGCEDLPPERTPEAQQVEDAFRDWLDALIDGDAATAFRMLTDGNKSQWLFDLLKAEDRAAHAWRLKLEDKVRTDVDLWYNYFKDRKADRVNPLPTPLLDSPGVFAVWKETFDSQRENIRLEMSRVKVTSVYADGGGATVTVLNAINKSEMYQMIIERGGWRIDHHKPGTGQQGR
jgi:hypothetical protein